MREINYIRQNYSDIKFIFDFFDRFALKLKKVSLKEETKDTLVFHDYHNDEIYIVRVRDVNRILDYCYNEYYFKIILSGSSYYQKIKKICEDLGVEYYIFDLFFKSFFLAIKACSEISQDHSDTKELVLWMVLNAYSTSFDIDSFPQIDINYYKTKAKMILKKLEELKLVCYSESNISNNAELKSYFPISCDTFRFVITDKSEGYAKSIPMFDFLDLRQYLNNSEVLNHNLLSRMDRAVQTLIVISFKDVKFNNNPYSDNSYIKKLRLDKNLYELSKSKKNA